MSRYPIVLSLAFGVLSACSTTKLNSDAPKRSTASLPSVPRAGERVQASVNRQLLLGADSQVDVTPLLKFIQTHTYSLASPKVIYHWAFRPDLRSVTNSTDDLGFQYAKKGASFYWQGQFEHPESDDFYGRGLYFSKDPVSTENYGESPAQNGDGWMLLQLTLPTTIKIFDLNGFEVSTASQTPADLEIKGILSALGCSDDVTRGSSGSWAKNLMRPKRSSTPTCISTIHKIFSELNPIDLFTYDYQAFNFSSCAEPFQSIGHEAFVVTDGSWIRPEFVRMYTPSTKDNLEGRQMIQGIFDRAYQENDADHSTHQFSVKPRMRQLWVDVPQNSIDPKYVDKFLHSFNFRCDAENLYQRN